MEEIAKIIAFQNRIDDPKAPMGSKIINLVQRYDQMVFDEMDMVVVLATLQNDHRRYGKQLLAALHKITEDRGYAVAVNIIDLKEGMLLDQNLTTVDNLLLMSKGQEISKASIMRLTNYGKSCGVKEPIRVIIPSQDGE